MKTISLFYMSKVPLGGFVTYTSQLCEAFRSQGYDCNIYKVRKTTERKERDFNANLPYRNVSIDMAEEIIAKSHYAIITATFWRGQSELISRVIEAGADVVIHDHTDYTKEFKDFLQTYDVRPIVIRKANQRNLRADGLNSIYIPHPYTPFPTHKCNRDFHAVSVCRLDYDKRTDIIIRANEMLPPSKRIHIWGTHTRMYMFQKIIGKYKGWTDTKHYTGPMYPREQQKFSKEPGFAVGINRRAEFSCDMSAIKGDGGGTQYSFLEAINGGAVLVLNKAWFTAEADELCQDVNCVAVTDAKELKDLLADCARSDFYEVMTNAKDILVLHKPERVVPLYIKFFRGEL